MLERGIGEKGVRLRNGGRQACQVEMNATEEPRRISLGIQGKADPGELRDDKSIDLVAFAIGRQGTVRGG